MYNIYIYIYIYIGCDVRRATRDVRQATLRPNSACDARQHDASIV